MSKLQFCVSVLAILLSSATHTMAQISPIKSDEQVTFFPTVGAQQAGAEWELPIHGWVYEPETNSVRRRMLLSMLCRSLALVEAACDTDLFRERGRYFLTDNESGKKVAIAFGSHRVVSAPSGSEGHFRATTTLSDQELQKLLPSDGGRWLQYQAILRSGDTRQFKGEVLALATHGVSIISDVDDTIKESNVIKREELLKNTFLRPFKSVAGMSELYRALMQQGADFHYVSASPWQLYPSLSEHLQHGGFPRGSFHMKEFRWKDSRFFDLLLSPDRFKSPILESLVSRFPNRRFVLVGDSGERDPEIYGALARKFPNQDIRIAIRSLADSGISSARSAAAFAEVSPSRWCIFTDGTLSGSNAIDQLTEFAFRLDSVAISEGNPCSPPTQ